MQPDELAQKIRALRPKRTDIYPDDDPRYSYKEGYADARMDAAVLVHSIAAKLLAELAEARRDAHALSLLARGVPMPDGEGDLWYFVPEPDDGLPQSRIKLNRDRYAVLTDWIEENFATVWPTLADAVIACGEAIGLEPADERGAGEG